MFLIIPFLLGSKSILFLGDSTVRHQFHVFCGNVPHTTLPSHIKKVECSRDGVHAAMPAQNLGGRLGYSDWALSDVKSKFRITADFDKARKVLMDFIVKTMGTNFTHVYFNGGLHILHLEPVRHWKYEEWRNAETMVLEFVLALKARFRKSRLIYMTSHDICSSKLNHAYRSTLESIEANRSQMCNRKHALYPQWATEAECAEGLMNGPGIRALNLRSLRVLPPDVTVNDCYSITSGWCNATNDGRHYAAHVIEKEVEALLGLVRLMFPL